MYGDMDVMPTAAQHQAMVGDAASETQHVLSKEDFLKLMLPDSPLVGEGRRKVRELKTSLKQLWAHRVVASPSAQPVPLVS
jgi:hypothetical protein